jgi:DNA-binding ferritin-like protein
MKGITATATFEGFVAMAQHAITNAQQQHWRTRSFAQHQALSEFYENFAHKLDELVECYQGREGLILIPEMSFHKEADPVVMIKTMRRFLDENREIITSYKEIQNQFDELIAIMNKALYKLQFLA